MINDIEYISMKQLTIFVFALEKCLFRSFLYFLVSPGSSAGKESTCNAGDPGLIPGLGRSPGEGEATHSSILGLPWWLRQ